MRSFEISLNEVVLKNPSITKDAHIAITKLASSSTNTSSTRAAIGDRLLEIVIQNYGESAISRYSNAYANCYAHWALERSNANAQHKAMVNFDDAIPETRFHDDRVFQKVADCD